MELNLLCLKKALTYLLATPVSLCLSIFVSSCSALRRRQIEMSEKFQAIERHDHMMAYFQVHDIYLNLFQNQSRYPIFLQRLIMVDFFSVYFSKSFELCRSFVKNSQSSR